MDGSANVASVEAAAMRRDAATWYGYLLLGFFTYLLNIQGNLLPFLRAELGLEYRAAALHSSAIALGMILVGLFGERVTRRLGRARALAFGSAGAALAAVALCMAPAAWASIGACFVLGFCGALIASVTPAMLADIHGRHRDRALAELGAACYAFAVMAPLAMGGSLALGFGWRGAVLAGVAIGMLILLVGRAARIPESAVTADRRGRLPPIYWVYWVLLALVVAIEFSVLLWAPAFLEVVVGLAPATAASTAALFALAMLVGRSAGSAVVGRIAAHRLYAGALLVTLAGFVPYWAGAGPVLAVPGLFVLGLGTALLYPLTLGLALEAAGPNGVAASARFMLAIGMAILTAPFLLGDLADRIGLEAAHLVIPALALLALAGLGLARGLERRLAMTRPGG
ncbi:MAG: MFS transporter [Geminicoccaceae bacterium]